LGNLNSSKHSEAIVVSRIIWVCKQADSFSPLIFMGVLQWYVEGNLSILNGGKIVTLIFSFLNTTRDSKVYTLFMSGVIWYEF